MPKCIYMTYNERKTEYYGFTWFISDIKNFSKFDMFGPYSLGVSFNKMELENI